MPQIKNTARGTLRKKKEKLRKTEKDRKKLEREYEKYVCFEKRLEQNRIRAENIGKEKKQKTKVNFPNLFRKHHNHHLHLHLGMGIKIRQKNTQIQKYTKVMKVFPVLSNRCIEVLNELKNICQTV